MSSTFIERNQYVFNGYQSCSEEVNKSILPDHDAVVEKWKDWTYTPKVPMKTDMLLTETVIMCLALNKTLVVKIDDNVFSPYQLLRYLLAHPKALADPRGITAKVKRKLSLILREIIRVDKNCDRPVALGGYVYVKHEPNYDRLAIDVSLVLSGGIYTFTDKDHKKIIDRCLQYEVMWEKKKSLFADMATLAIKYDMTIAEMIRKCYYYPVNHAYLLGVNGYSALKDDLLGIGYWISANSESKDGVDILKYDLSGGNNNVG